MSAHVVPLRKGDDRGASVADYGPWHPHAVPLVDQVVKVPGEGERERSKYRDAVLTSAFALEEERKEIRYRQPPTVLGRGNFPSLLCLVHASASVSIPTVPVINVEQHAIDLMLISRKNKTSQNERKKEKR